MLAANSIGEEMGMMARQRAVYVIEFKAGNGRKWFEADCEVTLSLAKAKFNHLVKSNPNDNWRVVKYYPRDDIEAI